MTSREIVSAALNHKPSGRVPMDFGGTAVTGMHVSCVAALREYYSLEKRPVKVHEPYQMLGWIDDDLKEAIGIDLEGVITRNTLFGFANERWKTWRTPGGLEVLVSEDFNTTVDENGDTLIYPGGDMNVQPSGRMPKGGYFFDSIIRQEPIDEESLNPEDNLEEFGPISEEELAWFAKQVKRAAATDRAVIATLPGTGFGDIALVPAPFLKHPKGIRDVAEWYISTVTRVDYIHAVFSRQAEYALANLEKLYLVLGDKVDAAFVCGTDFGTQLSTFCSAGTFKELYLPYYKQINGWIHRNTGWKTFKHSCGAVESFMELFIEAGFDIINPVQCSARGMEPEKLKARYGDRLVFWGGGVDTQATLPFGTPAEVREQVLRRCEIFSQNGGFVFNSVHNVQAKTPVGNIVSMIDAVHEFNGRR
ncbi:MAG TPA: uroporphyrinogen decarboxylase family protein [archaeon]|nr:uroporphyrinogen decarboxylase family protein [archaeon]